MKRERTLGWIWIFIMLTLLPVSQVWAAGGFFRRSVAVSADQRAIVIKNEFLPPLTTRYRHDQLIFPLRISSVNTTRTAKITLYVIAESTVSSSNFTTADLKFDDHLPELVAPEFYIEACIRKTIGSEGRGLVVMRAALNNRNPHTGILVSHALLGVPRNRVADPFVVRGRGFAFIRRDRKVDTIIQVVRQLFANRDGCNACAHRE